MKKIFHTACLCVFLTAASACINLDQPEVEHPPPLPEGPTAIFQDDFPFSVSEETPDASLVIPPTRYNCNIQLLMRGEDDYAMRRKLIRKARRSIDIQMYIFSGDPVGIKVGELLKKKKAKGLDVRLIIDAYTKFKFADRMLYFDLERSGVDVAGFEPVYFMGMSETSVFWIDEINERYHEKYFVVDDSVAITGGRNIADEYASYGDDPDNQWRDQDVVMTGPIVQDIKNAFNENHKYFIEREKNRPALLNPPWWRKVWNKITGAETGEESRKRRREKESDFNFLEFTSENVPVRLIRSRPRLNETYIYQVYIYLLRTARESVLIENAYFVPDKDLMDAMTGAAKRGVDVTIITNSDETNDVFQMQPMVRHCYKPLLEAGIKVYEWQGIVPGHGSLHSKFAIIDKEILVIGSYNLDPRSKYLNSEDVVLIYSKQAAKKLMQFVKTEDLKNSEKIDMDKAKEWHSPKDLNKQFNLLFAMTLEDWW
jgi:phosphatidylserine/phosphatidylglycerophosphate/cardiolipin synthase-like enzyme